MEAAEGRLLLLKRSGLGALVVVEPSDQIRLFEPDVEDELPRSKIRAGLGCCAIPVDVSGTPSPSCFEYHGHEDLPGAYRASARDSAFTVIIVTSRVPRTESPAQARATAISAEAIDMAIGAALRVSTATPVQRGPSLSISTAAVQGRRQREACLGSSHRRVRLPPRRAAR